jgi:hypothetical protein
MIGKSGCEKNNSAVVEEYILHGCHNGTDIKVMTDTPVG